MASVMSEDHTPNLSVLGRAAPVREYVLAIGVTAVVTVICVVVEPLTGNISIALLYLLAVVAAGINLRRGPVLVVASSSALVWNFCFSRHASDCIRKCGRCGNICHVFYCRDCDGAFDEPAAPKRDC